MSAVRRRADDKAQGVRLDTLRAAALQQHRLAELGLISKPALNNARVSADPAATPGRASASAVEKYAVPPLSLAQRLGLVEAPPPALSADEWASVRARAAERQASVAPCTICQMPFAHLGEQLLLGCAHVFHRACLRSWERHSRRRSCPCCRQLYGQAYCIDDGAHHYRHSSAALLQAAWRALAARRQYALRRARADPERLRTYCAARLDSLSSALLRQVSADVQQVATLLADLDRQAAQRNGLLGHAHAQQLSNQSQARSLDGGAAEAAARARERGVRECSVCLQPCNGAGGRRSGLSVLSCSHVFHTHCVRAFEAFSLPSAPLCCPECRALYTRFPYDPHPSPADQPPAATAAGRVHGKGLAPVASVLSLPLASCAACGEEEAGGVGRISAAAIECMLQERRQQMAGRSRGLLLAQELVGTALVGARASRQQPGPNGSLAQCGACHVEPSAARTPTQNGGHARSRGTTMAASSGRGWGATSRR